MTARCPAWPRAVNQRPGHLEVRGRSVRIAVQVRPRRAIDRRRGRGDDEVARVQAAADAAARACANEARHAEIEQLFHHDREGRRAHARCLDADGHAVVRAGVAEHRAVLVDEACLVQAAVEQAGDHRRPAGIAGQQDERRVVARLGTKVNLWHGRESSRRLSRLGTTSVACPAAGATACATPARACGR